MEGWANVARHVATVCAVFRRKFRCISRLGLVFLNGWSMHGSPRAVGRSAVEARLWQADRHSPTLSGWRQFDSVLAVDRLGGHANGRGKKSCAAARRTSRNWWRWRWSSGRTFWCGRRRCRCPRSKSWRRDFISLDSTFRSSNSPPASFATNIRFIPASSGFAPGFHPPGPRCRWPIWTATDLPNDMCVADPRIAKLIVMPAPGTGERYAPFSPDPGSLPVDPIKAVPTGAVMGDFNEDGLTDMLSYYWGRTPILYLRKASRPAGKPLGAAAFHPTRAGAARRDRASPIAGSRTPPLRPTWTATGISTS